MNNIIKETLKNILIIENIFENAQSKLLLKTFLV